jgi:eukaryotic-like serine/threonine-protein kinase
LIAAVERIGKYELEELLGGGMSQVYRARDTVIGRTVAVKILTEAGCQDPDVKARFLAEARLAGNISHDHVLHIYDYGEDEKQRPFLVMEFLRGEDLRHAMRKGHTGDLKNRLGIALDVARALEYIHSLKIIHRDIKPDNIHISDTGVVKLMDFGIAKADGLGLTRTGYILGTPYYMAPEQVTGQGVTAQADVYAFGMLLYELLAGSRPISADTMERIFYVILNEPLDLGPLRNAGAPEAVCALVARCVAKRPEDRPQGMAPVCAAIESILAGREAPTEPLIPAPLVSMVGPAMTSPTVTAPESEPMPPAPRPRRHSWLLPAVLAVLVVLGSAGYWLTHRQPPAQPVPKPPAVVVPIAPAGMVEVAGGSFLFGENREPATLPAFYIDRTEVTNAAYQSFCQATNRALPDRFPAGSPDLPVVNVTFADAEAFARWSGKRLPTGREWEKAARGSDGRLFPWGNEKDASRANVGTKQIRPAEDFPHSASPSGALQMVGNVWEWIADDITPSAHALEYFGPRLHATPDEPWHPIRGLSFADELDDGAVWDFSPVPARWKNGNIGFRCAKDKGN